MVTVLSDKHYNGDSSATKTTMVAVLNDKDDLDDSVERQRRKW
jgi:hypothetical protein